MSHFLFTLQQPNQIPRQMRFRDLLPEGLVRLEACDGCKPAMVDVSPALIPWRSLAHYLVQLWKASRKPPFCFVTKRRIPDEVLEALLEPQLTDVQAQEVLRLLRKNGFFPPIIARKAPKIR